ncbi:MAG: hypothetical protein D3922_12015 [Candidatus Electrothrix sp. AR1]|nr:hypothetical protein [Candidatus Electrothrix sp. AR1]
MTAMKEPRLKSILTPVPNVKSHSADSSTSPVLLAAANAKNATNVRIFASTKQAARKKKYISIVTSARQHVQKRQSR